MQLIIYFIYLQKEKKILLSSISVPVNLDSKCQIITVKVNIFSSISVPVNLNSKCQIIIVKVNIFYKDR